VNQLFIDFKRGSDLFRLELFFIIRNDCVITMKLVRQIKYI